MNQRPTQSPTQSARTGKLHLRPLATALLALLALTGLAGCNQPVSPITGTITLTHPADLGGLEPLHGFKVGSFKTPTRWQYRGTELGMHRFFYYDYNGYEFCRYSVAIPRGVCALHFREEIPSGNPFNVILEADEAMFHFYLYQPDVRGSKKATQLNFGHGFQGRTK